MQTVAFGQIIQKSIDRTKLILFKPFSLKKWMFLLLIAYLAGALQGGGANFGGGGGSPHNDDEAKHEQVIDKDEAGVFESEDFDAQEYSSQEFLIPGQGQPSDFSQEKRCPLPQEKRCLLPRSLCAQMGAGGKVIVYSLIGLMVLLIMGLWLLFSWISARFQFVWLEAIIKNDASVHEPFRRYAKEGNSLFKFFIVFIIILIVGIGSIGWWGWQSAAALGLFDKTVTVSFFDAVKALFLPVVVLGAFMICYGLVALFVDHFVVTVMGLDRSEFSQAAKKCVELVKKHRLNFGVYFLLLIALGIITGVASFVLLLVMALAMIAAAAILFGIPYLLFVVLLKIVIIFYVFAGIAVLPFLLCAIVLLCSIYLPFAVFFRNFSLYFLSALECGYAPFALGEPMVAFDDNKE